MSGARVFHRKDMVLTEAVTPTGNTSIARLINNSISQHIGAGIEYLENVTIDWTVTYDEVLFILEGSLTIEFAEDECHVCSTGDIVWLPQGTHLKYILNTSQRTVRAISMRSIRWIGRHVRAR